MKYLCIIQMLLSTAMILRVMWCQSSPGEMILILNIVIFSLACINYELSNE